MRKILLLILMCVSLFVNAQVQDAAVDKYKTLFTTNFLRYIEWPEENKQNVFIIGVLDDKNMYDEFVKINTNKKYGHQTIQVQHFNNIELLKDCQILFISRTVHLSNKNILKIKDKIKNSPTLIITETANTNHLGMINFVVTNNKLKFIVDLTAVEEQGFKISNALTSMSSATVK